MHTQTNKPTVAILRSNERGPTDLGWLKSHHSFSFGGYQNPQRIHFGPLRVLNDDQVAPGKGFGTHPHDNMEIVSYVLSGTLEHKDSLGTGSQIHAGSFQRISAGTGITHSEFNPSQTQPVHFLQLWFFPAQQNTPPSYAEYTPPKTETNAAFNLIPVLRPATAQTENEHAKASGITVGQNVYGYLVRLNKPTKETKVAITSEANKTTFPLQPNRLTYLHVTKGTLAFTLNGTTHTLNPGDAAAINHAEGGQLNFIPTQETEQPEALLLDMGTYEG